MRQYQIGQDATCEEYLEVPTTGTALLRDPLLNKGTAFTTEEREVFGLAGFLPAHAATLEEQLQRMYENYSRKESAIEKHIFLRSLQDRNETLFYALRAREVTDAMFTAAAHRLFELVPEERLRQRCVYPAYAALRDVSKQVAIAVGEAAVRDGVASPRTHDEIVAAVETKMWVPHYLPYRAVH